MSFASDADIFSLHIHIVRSPSSVDANSEEVLMAAYVVYIVLSPDRLDVEIAGQENEVEGPNVYEMIGWRAATYVNR